MTFGNQECLNNYRYRRINPIEARGLFDSFKTCGGNQYNWVVATSIGAVGAGHARQADYMREVLKLGGLQNNLTYIEIPYDNPLIGNCYRMLQNIPWLYNSVNRMLDEPALYPLVDKLKEGSTVSQQLLPALLNSPTYDKKKPTVFIATHVDLEHAAITLMNKKLINGKAVVAAIPDPWEKGILAGMSSPKKLENGQHIVLVHDEATAEEYQHLRTTTGAAVLPFGTASDPHFLLHEQEAHDTQPHIGIEFSGNPVPNYDALIVQFIKSIQKDLIEGKMKLTIHMMHHKTTAKLINNILEELHLKLPNVRCIVKDTLSSAIESRKQYIRGELNDGWPPPRAVISKGGEVPIEHRGNQLVVGVWGAGHEEKDIKTGVQEGRAIDCRDTHPSLWLAKMKEELEKRKNMVKLPSQSLVVFAPLLVLNPRALDPFKIPA